MMPSILPLAPRCGTGHLERSDFTGNRLHLQQMSTHPNIARLAGISSLTNRRGCRAKCTQVSSNGLARASQPCCAIQRKQLLYCDRYRRFVHVSTVIPGLYDGVVVSIGHRQVGVDRTGVDGVSRHTGCGVNAHRGDAGAAIRRGGRSLVSSSSVIFSGGVFSCDLQYLINSKKVSLYDRIVFGLAPASPGRYRARNLLT